MGEGEIMPWIMTVIVFGIVFSVFGFIIIRGIVTWVKNNNSPIVNMQARVVAKRLSLYHNNTQHSFGGSTTYYATFEFETRERLELRVPHKKFGLIAEGDFGTLTYQGTRFLSFERDRCR